MDDIKNSTYQFDRSSKQHHQTLKMFKFVVLAMVICAANAGLIGLGHEQAHVVAVSHGASSYQNHNQVSVHPVPVVATHHAVAHAPIAVAAPVAVAHAPIAFAHAPIAVAHAPIALGHGIGLHGFH